MHRKALFHVHVMSVHIGTDVKISCIYMSVVRLFMTFQVGIDVSATLVLMSVTSVFMSVPNHKRIDLHVDPHVLHVDSIDKAHRFTCRSSMARHVN